MTEQRREGPYEQWRRETDEIRAREGARLDAILRWLRSLDGPQDPRRLAEEIEATSAVPPAPATEPCDCVRCDTPRQSTDITAKSEEQT